MHSFAHFDSPGQIVWNVVMSLCELLVIVDLARGSRWSSRRERIWTAVLVLGPTGGFGGFWLPIGVLAWVTWYRWRETAGYHPNGRLPSAHVEDGADDVAGAHGGDGVVDLR